MHFILNINLSLVSFKIHLLHTFQICLYLIYLKYKYIIYTVLIKNTNKLQFISTSKLIYLFISNSYMLFFPPSHAIDEEEKKTTTRGEICTQLTKKKEQK